MLEASTQTATSGPRRRSSRRVLDAARELVDRDGLDQLSMRRLAAAADVSVRTIYNVFGDRDGVVTALVLESFAPLEAAMDGLGVVDPLERIWEAVTLAVEGNCRYVPKAVVAAVVADPALARRLGSRWQGWRIAVDALQDATRRGVLRDDVPAERLVEHAGAVLLHLLGRWARDEIDERALRAAALHAFDVCLLAVARPKARTRLLEHMAAIETALPDTADERPALHTAE